MEQVGAVGVQSFSTFGCRGSGFGVSLVAGVARFEGWVRRSLRAGTPPTPKIWNRGLTGLALGVCVCLGVGGVPHQLYGGGRVRVRDFRADAKMKHPHAQCIRLHRISAQK